MGKVIIIKNNDINSVIHRYAFESYENKEARFYYTTDGTVNENYIREHRDEIEKEFCQ